MIYRKNKYLDRTKTTSNLSLIALFLLVLSITFSPVAFAQTADSSTSAASTEVQKTDTAFTNKTMKSVFKELKHITKTGNATLNSILMILGVVSVVAIAMWLSFRADPEEEGA
jgi:hypothetical protein